MAQAYRNSATELDGTLNTTTSGSGQRGQRSESWFTHHSRDASDASLAEFEQLMAAMGYRRQDSIA